MVLDYLRNLLLAYQEGLPELALKCISKDLYMFFSDLGVGKHVVNLFFLLERPFKIKVNSADSNSLKLPKNNLCTFLHIGLL